MTRSRSDSLIAHIADLHLDAAKPESIAALEFALDRALEQKARALVIAGDVWERGVSVDDKSVFTPALALIGEAARHMPVIGVYGNHDRAGSLEPFDLIQSRHRVLFAARPQSYYEADADVMFHLLPYPQKSRIASWVDGSQDDSDVAAGDALRRIVQGFAADDATRPDAMPRVLVYHGNVTGCKVESGQVMLGGDVMIGAADLEASGADYVALGHIHGRQMLGTRSWYPGSTYHCNYGETEQKYMHLVHVWRGGCEVEAVRMPSRRKVTVVMDLDDQQGYAGPDESYHCEGADVKLRVRMTEEQAATFDALALISSFQDFAHPHAVFIERIIIPRERVRCETITDAQALRDKVAAWGGAVGEEIPAGVLDKADEVEGGAR
jgi:DNA repair exonuclease SbcCD nuclease subunit